MHKTNHMHFIYFLESTQHPDHHYIGYTENIQKRIVEHNHGQVLSTKNMRPWKLIYAEIYSHKLDALHREKFLKSGGGWKYLQKQLHHHLAARLKK